MTDQKKSKDLKHQSTGAVVMIHALSANMSAMRQVNLTWNDEFKKPGWFDPLVTKIDDAKVVASTWSDSLLNEVVKTVPGQILNYGPTFREAVAQIQDIAFQHPDARGKDNQYVIEVVELLEAIKGQICPILKDVDNTTKKLKQFQSNLQVAADKLNEGVNSIQNAEAELQQDITKMNAKISSLEDEIKKMQWGVAAGGITTGVSLILIVGGIALAPETGGVSLLASGVGLLGVVGGAATITTLEVLMHKDMSEIKSDQAKIKKDNSEITLLKTLSTSTKLGLSALQNAIEVLVQFRAGWVLLEAEIQGVLDKIETAEENAPLKGLILAELLAKSAVDEWADAEEYAMQLQDAPVEIKTFTATGDQKKAA